MVIKFYYKMMFNPTTFKLLAVYIWIVMGYKYLSVAVTNLESSISFYGKLGFKLLHAPNSRLRVLQNAAGFSLHLFQSRKELVAGKNILMDVTDEEDKLPGHTHMSFGVQSIRKTREYFEQTCAFEITGTRRNLAIFIRDPDRTTIEFERNDGIDPADDPSCDPSEYDPTIDSQIISKVPRGGIDHIGTRISNPLVNSQWYGKALGFTKSIFKYEIDVVNVKKNQRPWIIRTQSGRTDKVPQFESHYPAFDGEPPSQIELMNEFDENLILNANVGGVNPLLNPGEDPFPGIIYAAIEVDDVSEAVEKYRSDFGEDGSLIEESQSELWGVPADMVLPMGYSVFIRDPDQSVFRLVGRQ